MVVPRGSTGEFAARLAFGVRAGARPRGAGTRLNREVTRLGKWLAREEQASERHKETIRRQYDEDIQLRAALRRLRDQSDRVRSLSEEIFWLRIALDGAKAGKETLKARLVKLRVVGATLSKLPSDEAAHLRAALRRSRRQKTTINVLSKENARLRRAVKGSRTRREASDAQLAKLRATGKSLSKSLSGVDAELPDPQIDTKAGHADLRVDFKAMSPEPIQHVLLERTFGLSSRVDPGFDLAGRRILQITIAVADILPMRLVDDSVRNSCKFQQIGASVREIGIVQPPIVARRPELKGKYLLLDGHLRIEILKDMKVDQVTCLVSLDDEAVTYNRQVNRLTPVQEHKMILKVIERGIPEQRIAQALNVDVASIRIKRDLLNGICPEVAALLKDKHCPINSFQTLRKAKPLRQYEIAKTMIMIGNYSIAYVKALASASSPDQLVDAGKPKAPRGISPEEIEQIERELANLQGDVKRIEATFATDHLNLVVTLTTV